MSHECPTCGDEFDSERGMKIHHKRIHDESIAGVEKQCENCGDTFRAKNNQRNRRRCCSKECMGELRSGEWAGENAPNWKGGDVEVECSNCGVSLMRSRGEYNRSTSWFFCSNDCEIEHKREHQSGETHPCWEGEHLIKCDWCGEDFHDSSAQSLNNDHHFCGMECYGNWCSENRVGEDHPNWKGGWEEYYGPNWEEQREKALSRDGYECVECGRTSEEHKEKFDTELLVHHIEPMRWFKQNYDAPECYERANKLTNLATLCRGPCHRKWEVMSPLRPQTASD